PGFGEYLYLYRDSDNVYGVKEGVETGEKLFSWLDCDVDSNNVEQFAVLDDGQVIALERDWSAGNGSCNLVRMEQVDPATLPEKQELVLGCMYLDYNLRPLIVRFNRNNSDIRIVVRDYSELAQDGAYEDAIQRLNTEIISGAGPDILAVDSVPLVLMERDDMMGKRELMEEAGILCVEMKYVNCENGNGIRQDIALPFAGEEVRYSFLAASRIEWFYRYFENTTGLLKKQAEELSPLEQLSAEYIICIANGTAADWGK
ncbi:MAG: hypothetical protein IJB15_10570, partial [Clostridia bacterium]|nr:hypothetical protein [Clostridia bacterium]